MTRNSSNGGRGRSLLASDHHPPPAVSISMINKDLLVRLNPDQFLTLKCKYPPGCYIYFSITTNVLRSTFEACRGVVTAIYIDLESKEIVYEIIETTTKQQRHNTNDNGLIVEERLFLLEKDLAFASNCQVRVEGKDATELGVNGLVGSIICPQFTTPDNKSYTIQFTVDGGSRVIGMYNVDPKEVVYVPSKSCNDDDDDDDDDDDGGENGGTVDTKLQSNVETGNSLLTGVARREMDKTNDNVNGNLHEQSSTVQIQQTLLTNASDRPLVSCDSASSSLTSEQQQEAVSLDIRQEASTTNNTVDESSSQKLISVLETPLQRVSPLTVCSFEYTHNGTIQVQTKKVFPRWEPPN